MSSLALALAAAFAAAHPQQGGAAASPRPLPRIEVGDNGWPVPREWREGEARPAAEAARVEPGGFPRAATRSAERGSADTDSPLAPVFRRVGYPGDAGDLGCVVARVETTVFDHRGAALAETRAFHEADLAAPDRDRLLLAGDRIYGRDGGAVFAVQHHVAFPSLEEEARDELELMGLLLRLPWAFADRSRFVVMPAERLEARGRPAVRFRIEARAPGDEVVGPAPGPRGIDRFELWCDPETMEPRLLSVARGATGSQRTFRLLDYQTFGGVRVATRREVEAGGGAPARVMVLAQLDVRQQLPRAQFQPPAR
jgi:hypothetical protein